MARFLAIVVLLGIFSSAAVAEKAPWPALAVPDTLGVNIHFTSPKAGEMEMLAGGGFKWVRMDFTWGGTERKKGEYDFSAYDKLIKSLEPHGIRALFILDYANKLYDQGLSPHSEEGRVAMAKWAAAAVTHFKGKQILWEMWNEPNIPQFWKPKPKVEDYAKLALEVGKAVRAAAPDELYCGPGTSQVDLKFIEECFKAGVLEYWDAVTVHPYRQKDPETACEEYRKLRLMIAKYAPKGKTIPIISGEWGYSAAWGKFDEERQGKYLPREFLVNLYNEIPLSIWYDWHNDGQDPKEAEHHFGTVKFPYKKDQTPVYEPKAAYLAVQTLSKQLGGFGYNKRLWMGEEQDWVLLFAKGQEVKLAVWTTSKTPRAVTIPASAGKFVVVNHLGDKTTAMEADGKGLKIMLTDTVQYLTPEKSNDLLRVGAAWARAKLEVMVKAPALASYCNMPENSLGRPLRVKRGDKEYAELPISVSGRRRGGGSMFLWGDGIAVSRGDATRDTADELDIENMGVLRQRVHIAVTNTVAVTPLPASGNRLPVLIENPSGDRFDGRVSAIDTTDLELQRHSVPVEISQGSTQTIVTLPVGRAGATYRLGLNVADHTGLKDAGNISPEREFKVAPVSFAAADFFGPADGSALSVNLKVHVDGDRKIKSEQSIALGAAPEAMPAELKATALKVEYAFEAGWKFIRVAPAQEALKAIPAKAEKLGMWVYGDGSGNKLIIRYIDSVGQCFQPVGHRLNFKGWQWVTFPLDGSEAGHWGGKNDGVVQGAIRLDTLVLVDSAHQQKTSGVIWVAGVAFMGR